MAKTVNDVLNYLLRLREIKKTLQIDGYYVHFEEGIYTIFKMSDNLPVISMTQKNFEIFEEIETL